MDLDFVSVHKHAKKEFGYYPAILTEQAWSITHIYYRTGSVSGQDEPSPALRLVPRGGKMELYCPLGISRLVRQDQRFFFGVLSHISNPLLTKIVPVKMAGYWPRSFFCVFMDRDEVKLGQ